MVIFLFDCWFFVTLSCYDLSNRLLNYVYLLLQADFMKMPFADNTYDAVYAVEATCHAPDAVCASTIYSIKI